MTEDSPARVTIKSIARDLGISHMTVSRALSGSTHVNDRTRQTIIEYAKRIGYVKSTAAGVMRGEPTAFIGLLLPNIINEFYARFANHLGALCAEAGFDLVIHLTNDLWQQERKSLERLQALQARVVVRVPAPRGSDQPACQFNTLQVINLIRTQDEQSCKGALLIDDGASIRAAVAHLVKTGRRRIAYLGAAESMTSGLQRLLAFREGLSEFGLSADAERVCTGPPGFAMGRHGMAHLLDSQLAPDAIVCGGFEISNGALETCLSRNLVLPDELAFVGYGDPGYYRWIAGGITTIALSEQQLAREAIQMIRECALDRATTSLTVSTALNIRHSA